MSEAKIRPLISLTLSQQQNLFIPLPYIFTVSDVKIIINYLPKIYKLIGLDCQHQTTDAPQQFNSLKWCRIIGSQGICIKGPNINQNLKFLDKSQIVAIRWNIPILLNIPYSNKTAPQKRITEEFINKLSNYVHILDSKKTQIASDNETMTPKQVSNLEVIFSIPPIQPQSAFKSNTYTHILSFETNLPVLVLINQRVQKNKLANFITRQVAQSLSIIIKNKLSERIIRECTQSGCSTLFVHNYLSDQQYQKSTNAWELFGKSSIFKKLLGNQQKNIAVENGEHKSSNLGLIVILIILVILYGTLKALKPFEKLE